MNYQKYILGIILFLTSISLSANHFKNCFCSQISGTSETETCIRKGVFKNREENDYMYKYWGCYYTGVLTDSTKKTHSNLDFIYEFELNIFKNKECIIAEFDPYVPLPYTHVGILASVMENSIKHKAVEAGFNQDRFEEVCQSFKKQFFTTLECDDGFATEEASEGKANCVLTSFEDNFIKFWFSFVTFGLKMALPNEWYSKSHSGSISGTITCVISCESSCKWSCYISEIAEMSSSVYVDGQKNSPEDNVHSCRPISKAKQGILLADISNVINKYLGLK